MPTTHRLGALTAGALLLVPALALSGCAAEPDDAASDAAGSASSAQTRTVEHEFGTAEIPVDPENIVVLDEYAAVELISVGITPQIVYPTLQSESSGYALGEVDGIEIVDDASDFLASPDLEAIAALDPDVLVMSGTGPLAAIYDDLAGIAPVVAIPNTSWQEALEFTGEAFGAEDRAAAVQTALESRFEEVSEPVSQLGSVSVLFGFQGAIYSPSGNAPLSGELADAGVERIEVEASSEAPPEADNITPVSAEELPAHAADLTILLDRGYYVAQTVLDAPAFSDGKSAAVDGDSWFGQNPFAVSWVLDDLEAISAGAEPGDPAADSASRWADFLALVGA